MAEKIENKKTEEVVEENVDETNVDETETVNEQSKNEKGFSQQEVNRIVQTRLKKVKGDYDVEINGYKEQLTEYENLLKGMVEELKKDIPEEFKELLEDSSIMKQFQVLTKRQKTDTKKVPLTPKSEIADNKNSNKPTKHLSGW
jgi:hypothetical protein